MLKSIGIFFRRRLLLDFLYILLTNLCIDQEEWRDIALRVATGSGKTLAYLSSALTSVSRELYNREKVIFDSVVESVEASEAAADVGSSSNAEDSEEEEGSDTTALSRKMAFALSPSLVMAELGSGAQVWLRQPEAAQRQPLVMVLCPSRELCAQVAMQLHQLVGGNVRQVRKNRIHTNSSAFSVSIFLNHLKDASPSLSITQVYTYIVQRMRSCCLRTTRPRTN